jgi:putative endonuclease
MPRTFHVYIMASASRRLYVGVTGNLTRRVDQHRRLELKGFTRKYQMVRLVYVEATSDVNSAIRREKQIKGWVRAKKISLIESLNPGWLDLGADLLGDRRGEVILSKAKNLYSGSGEILRCAQDDTRSG